MKLTKLELNIIFFNDKYYLNLHNEPETKNIIVGNGSKEDLDEFLKFNESKLKFEEVVDDIAFENAIDIETLEAEKKFLIENLPDDMDEKYEYRDIEQVYLNKKKVVLRVRKNVDENTKYIFNAKTKGSKVRNEAELAICKEDYEYLKNNYILGNEINKRRYLVPYFDENLHKELTMEVDDFKGDLDELISAEVETRKDDIDNIYIKEGSKIDDIVISKDVTEDNKYKNSNLAMNGL